MSTWPQRLGDLLVAPLVDILLILSDGAGEAASSRSPYDSVLKRRRGPSMANVHQCSSQLR